MALDTDVFSADLAAMIADLPAMMKYGGREFNVSVNDLVRRATLEMNGNMEEIDMAVELLASSVAGLPALKAQGRVEIRRPGEAGYTKYEIVSVGKSADAIGITLGVMQDRRN